MVLENIFLIGLIGTAGSGKSYNAKIIENNLNDNFSVAKTISFADSLRDLVFTSLGLENLDDKEYSKFKKRKILPGVTGRNVLQNAGVWLRNNLGEDIWVELLKSRIEKELEKNINLNYVIIPDVRFYNELEFITENGGDVLLCDYKSKNRIDSPNKMPQHESELLGWLATYKLKNKIKKFNNNYYTLNNNQIKQLKKMYLENT